MVGLFHIGTKSSPSRTTQSTDSARPMTPPPPQYAQNGDGATYFAAETTTTTHIVTTTQTTTHFFSLPLWRRRTQQPTPTTIASPTPKSSYADEMGMARGSSLPARDKDLPPTPPLEDEAGPSTRTSSSHPSLSHTSESRNIDPSPSQPYIHRHIPPRSTSSCLSPPVGGAIPEPASQGTTALARAALGLGLPPLMFNAIPDPESSDGSNAISFAVSETRPERKPSMSLSSASIRRAKSFQRESDEERAQSHAALRERRRTRGLSLGPLLTSNEAVKDEMPAERKSLSRKSSFWSRKRNDSHAPPPVTAPPANHFLEQPSLPSLQPVSPFNMETSIGESAGQRSDKLELPSSPDLRRRHSEKLSLSRPAVPSLEHEKSEPSKQGQGQRRQRMKRPQTAGPTARGSRVQSSHFPGPVPITAEPAQMEGPVETTPTNEITSCPTSTPPVSSRPRSTTNPPLLHRLSINIFGSSPSSSPITSHAPTDDFTRSPSTSFSSSRPSPKVSVEIPRPRHDEESPELYLQRLTEAVSKAEVASVLAATADEFHAKALRAYIAQFNFMHDPLDVALRKLLMEVGLPRETQQIDRVMEAFAERYRQCHPTLFTSDDHPYILAFSLIMLHTDAFNKSNKRKMTKADYIKNTRLPGVAPEILDCFYDNTVFAPFIFIEDPLDINGQRGLLPEGPTARRMSTLTSSPGSLSTGGSTLLGKSNKVDPYYLITWNLLDDLRVDIRSHIPLTSPYLYQGTGGTWNEDKLLRAFATAGVVEITSENRYIASPWFGLNVGGGPSTVAMMSAPTFPAVHDLVTLTVTKVGQLLRKEEILEGGRKASSRKWREWSVLLTGSQLLFSRDPNWATMVQTQSHIKNRASAAGSHPLLPRPDEMLSLRDAVAVYDQSYDKHTNTLRLVISDGRHYLLQAKDEQDLNEWISCVNYASTFKSTGVRMRSLGMSGKDIELTGQAAAVSHLRDIQHRDRPSPASRIKTWDGRTSPAAESYQTSSEHTRTPSETTSEEPVTPPLENPSGLFKATFDQVKAELASGNWQGLDTISVRSGRRTRACSLESAFQSPVSPELAEEGHRIPSRTRIIQSKVHDLESKLAVQRSQLDADMRFVKNVAILAPFQRATRDRLQLAVQNVGKRIMQIRLELEKLSCHRDVLIKDLEAEERDWERTKNMALRAAKLELERKHSMPQMSLSVRIDDKASSPIGGEYPQEGPSTETWPQSAAESFHSALDFPIYSGSEDKQRLSVVATLDSPASTVPSDGLSSPFPDAPRPLPLSAHSSMDGGPNLVETGESSRASVVPETFEEQAEEWNKTRAAKRVSLVRLPSDLRMSVLLGKHTRNQTQIPSEDSGTTITPGRAYHPAYHPASSLFSPSTRANSTIDDVLDH
ncbi:uncharacterized protein PHACADRAFT_204113 [Phanerochaete carnosa HHB-10118-sp]|uniref:SEC7 domain-containing protein n=1 Tax=Phanerochaete carnosa (strain HHB-10118-sp) TaxID=650164 RepID=K5WAK7_PHACS|nr:uncharacterized protein PHACADRAFT_204113 [Phanerochaete carnosa HHB-10118-sp]EKM60968.1 hypothetical protein PHACADRAFT_204113 [Phanerochaete carnosa HHB-10118-sp]